MAFQLIVMATTKIPWLWYDEYLMIGKTTFKHCFNNICNNDLTFNSNTNNGTWTSLLVDKTYMLNSDTTFEHAIINLMLASTFIKIVLAKINSPIAMEDVIL